MKAFGVLAKCVLGSRKMSGGSRMDPPKSRTENFARFLRSAAADGILRVHGDAWIAPHAPISIDSPENPKSRRLGGGSEWNSNWQATYAAVC